MQAYRPKRILVTFADSRLVKSLARVKRQASVINVYDEILAFDEHDLDEDFKMHFASVMIHGSRGFGYWCWKPHVILKVLKLASLGDIIHWIDVGCWLNFRGRARLIEYFEMVDKSELGLVGFQVKNEQKLADLDGFSIREKVWTKGDLFDYFGVRNDERITETEQIETTSFFVKKTEESMRIIQKWMQVWYDDIALIDDSPSRSSNLVGFFEHRHDQSAFSILLKQHNAPTISAFEMYYPLIDVPGRLPLYYKYDWTCLDDFPVWAKRDKDLRRISWLKKKIHNLRVKWLKILFGIKQEPIW